ncbi:metallophosphoesterase [Tractidigestivibacter sp.]|uniref:metallophosphoesterase n=1 Tax=Tractidigestivibacter sp. TaxID=2847320 RepID=UPI002A91140C|nr:metallophosphoesterase [Tractidigestivibacter sp.]MCI6273980.1 metallophosphoesterase [Coriobacteriaceae bacterium]MDY5270549.1 metallophosphoesterase [Tractidigestivibacter sp.]
MIDETDGRPWPLRFDSEGRFRVLQLSDIQETSHVREDTMALLRAALDEAKPDLVVLTGDQIKGYAVEFALGEGAERARTVVRKICLPMVERSVPFVVTYGNHDRQCGVGNEGQESWYEAIPGCVNGIIAAREPALYHTAGTLAVPVLSHDGGDIRLAVVVADSGAGTGSGGYEPFDPALTSWITGCARGLAGRAGHRVPCILYQHIPPVQVYDCLREACEGERGVPGFRARYHPGHTLVPADELRVSGGLREPVCSPDTDTGEVAALMREGSTFAVYFGHDHKNTLVSRYGSMDLGYAPSAGFGSYGPGTSRAARLFSFGEEDPARYATCLLTYAELVGSRTERPLADWASERVPVSAEEAREIARPALPVLGAAAIAAFALGVARRRGKGG